MPKEPTAEQVMRRARLEDLTLGASVAGVDPRGPVRVIQAQWHGADCLDLTYRDATGRTDSRLLYRDDEPRHFHPMLSVHTSLVEPLPHQIEPTPTPHNGKEEDFQLLMSLLDADRFEGRFRNGAHVVDVSDLMRRKVKEDLLKFDGTPLLPERRAYTVSYELSDPEAALYHEVTQYVQNEFNRPDQLESGARHTSGATIQALIQPPKSDRITTMPSLSATNKHLRTAGRRREAVRLTVATSSAIEGISAPFRVKGVATRKVAKGTKKAIEPARVKAYRPEKTD